LQAVQLASAQLDFEHAAALHKRLEKVDAVRHSVPELARPLQELNAIVLQRAAEETSVAVFVVRAGIAEDPFLLQFGRLASQPRPVEQILRDILDPVPAPCDLVGVGAKAKPARNSASAAELEDHLALLARWFYGRPREGELFFEDAGPHGAARNQAAGWPYRRILRACSRLLAPREPETQT
jgi:excinuclease ABC subunit C